MKFHTFGKNITEVIMHCVLCLENGATNYNGGIQINSVEGSCLRIKEIIEKHFWLHFTELETSTSSICSKCWDSLNAFHEFYLQVVRVHRELKKQANDEKVPSCTETPISIAEVVLKPEEDVEKLKDPPEDPFGCPNKRPRLHRNIQLENPVTEQSNEEVKEEPPITKRRRGRPPKNKNIPSETPYQQQKDTVNNEYGKISECPGAEHLVIPMQEIEVEDYVGQYNHSGSNNDKLKISKFASSQTARIQQHDEFIAANFKLSCCICKCFLENFSELNKHFRSMHKIAGYVICCGTKFRKRGLLVDHLHLHQDENYFKCTICDKIMLNRKGLNLHMKTHTQRERTFTCEICSKSFFNRIIYMSHKFVHVPEEEKHERCSECDKTFATKYLLTKHIRLVHLKVDAKVCDICGKTVRGREAFLRHQNFHRGVERTFVKCKLCTAMYSNNNSLKYHMKMMHTEENLRPQECSICSKVSANLMVHRRHMAQHRLQRKHICTLCGKGFKKSTTLKEHMTTHTGEILYTCPHCPKTFNARANMHSHRKKAHRKEWDEARTERDKLKHLKTATALSVGEVTYSSDISSTENAHYSDIGVI